MQSILYNRFPDKCESCVVKMQFFKKVVVVFRREISWKRVLGRLIYDFLHVLRDFVQCFRKINVFTEGFGKPFNAGRKFMIAGVEDDDRGIAY